MKGMRRLAAVILLASGIAGCAPAFGTGPRILASRGGLSAVPACFMYGDGLMAMGLSAGPRFWGQRAHAYQLQARHGLASYDVRAQMSTWKDVASGC